MNRPATLNASVLWTLAAAAVVGLLTTPAAGDMIDVPNHSFEEGADGSGGAVNQAPWKRSSNGSNFISIQELSGIGAQADPAPDGTDTTHYTNATGDNIHQVLAATLAGNTIYTLWVDVGDRTDLTAQPGSIRLGYVSASPVDFDDFGLNLLPATVVNDTVPVNGAGPTDGWETWESTFTTGPAPAGLGQSLRIELVTDAGVQTLWDNARLTSAIIPEPSSAALFGLGGLACLLLRRRLR